MNLAERGLLRDGSLFNKNRSKRSDQMPADNGCLERTTERVSIRAFSCFGRLVLPILVVTILVYCWLAVKGMSYVHHVSLRHTHTTSVRERENTTLLCTRQEDSKEINICISESNGHAAITNENNADQHQNVTPSDLKVANGNENGSYFTNPIDKHDYKYIHNPESLCKKNTIKPQQNFLLTMITTAPENVERRNIIRSSYGNEKDWEAFANHNLTVLTVFLLGRTNNATLQMDIDKESDLHDDIVQEDFVDCYDNLTMKTVMGLKWVTNHCRHATFVIKFVDTAVIIQTKLYQRWLYTALIDVPKTTWAAGQVRMDAKVFRNTDDKFYISKDFYAFPTYPPYLDGQGYVLSTDLVEAIYKVAITTPLFPCEDVFIGMCLQKLHVVPTNIKNFV
ncbi:beta-1,3-galactosyltransferase 1-like [Strongylocentrotus purpuratus]|uniref:Hexosyltransferase n=1 Tax=Strongylocentrotus purpuratus TaxID=7668 RepID=A0A7M7N7N3_STRPU|nr:beta-1,3-galactosyltransferase 1-like [Strongylocentrotus purpuratus]